MASAPAVDPSALIHDSPVRRAGRWTAVMVLRFNLHRPDEFPSDDRRHTGSVPVEH
jgi:hypothetical protein